ncbi:filament-like plant protein 7 isoform X2 [Diospyros lotus]|uniref:filament-like plant protein 7 isoform X2 n=1 Tax=Diospyros lotus TaxID=55363 RepID=UPI002254C630|nr:filament-like plant protein 7 isoform X2 [Diospyros lotus]
MDHKAWLWRKRSSEKTIVAKNAQDIASKGNEEEMTPSEKEVYLERLANLNEKLESVLRESETKDELLARHAKMVEETTAGWEKAEAEVVSLKQQLGKVSQEKMASNERLTELNAALKESMQQLNAVRENQEQRVHDAVMKTSREFEKAQKKLEEKLTEKSRRLANLTAESTRLSKALLMKEKLIEDLSKDKSQTEAEFNTLMSRLDSVEKENAFLKYEFRMLEKEFQIRNEEIEFNRQSADVAYKQHLEGVKKIAKLEAECQRLRVLVRKRLPGPAALAKMKSEVEILGRNHSEIRRRKLNPVTGSLVVSDHTLQTSEIPNKKINFLIERLCDIEEENKTLKAILAKKDVELHSSQLVCTQTSSKLSMVETQCGELAKGQKSMELAMCSPMSKELSPTPSFGTSNDEITHSESWACALISELDYFRNQKPKTPNKLKPFGVSDMSLMDDFVEMEKLATASIHTPTAASCASSDGSNALAIYSEESSGYHLDARGKELVAVVQQYNDIDSEIHTNCDSTRKSYNWLENVLKLILDQNRISKRSFEDLLEDVRIALTHMKHSCATEGDKEQGSKDCKASDPVPISGYITWKSPNTSPRVGPLCRTPYTDSSAEESNQHGQSSLSRSIHKTIEVIRRIDPACSNIGYIPDNVSERDGVTLQCKLLTKPSDYMICIFQCKSSELSSVLQQFIHVCDDLLDGKANFENFAAELASALDWIVDNCVISQDVSSTRVEDSHLSEEQLTCLLTSSNGQNVAFAMEKIQSALQEEIRGLKDELKSMESSKIELEVRLKSSNDKNEAAMSELQEAEQNIGYFQKELNTLKESKGLTEDQIENQKLINEDLDTQLSVTKVKLNEVLQKLSSLEVELEDKNRCCEELEGTCLELQLQLEREVPRDSTDQEGKLLQSGWEITAASAKLAECQETILNLGKQLNALACPRETSVFDKVITTTSTTNKKKKLSQRSSLRDRMLAEDDAEAEDQESPNTKEIISTVKAKTPPIHLSGNQNPLFAPSVLITRPEAYLGLERDTHAAAFGSLAIVASKKRGKGFGLLRKLLSRRKRGSSKKASRFLTT